MIDILRKLLKDERGQALLVVLILLSLGGLMIAPLLNYMRAGLNATRVHGDLTGEQYSADSAIEHAGWRLLYESGFTASMTEQNPTVQYSININGRDTIVTVTRLAGASGLGTFSFDVDYVIPEGHILESKVMVTDDNEMHFAYDTEDYSSWLFIPATSGNITYYLHNNPTPPDADTNAQAALPMDETQSTATELYNYDQNFNSYPGRTINDDGEGPNETNLRDMQNWQTSPYPTDTHIQGTVVVNVWVAPEDWDYYDEDGCQRVYLRDYDPVLDTYTEITSADFCIDEGQWLESWTSTAPEGKYKIVATDGNTEIKAIVGLDFTNYLKTISFVYNGS